MILNKAHPIAPFLLPLPSRPKVHMQNLLIFCALVRFYYLWFEFLYKCVAYTVTVAYHNLYVSIFLLQGIAVKCPVW